MIRQWEKEKHRLGVHMVVWCLVSSSLLCMYKRGQRQAGCSELLVYKRCIVSVYREHHEHWAERHKILHVIIINWFMNSKLVFLFFEGRFITCWERDIFLVKTHLTLWKKEKKTRKQTKKTKQKCWLPHSVVATVTRCVGTFNSCEALVK